MSKNIVFSFLFVILFANLISCGKVSPKGKIDSKDVPIEDFNQIQLKGKFRVFFVSGDKNFVNVETYPNVFKNLKIKVSDKSLNISENHETQGVDFYNITIYSKYNPEKISISDSVEMNISGGIKTDNFKLNLKNNAKFIGAVKSRRAEIDMQNTSRANFTGFTNAAVMKITDTASIIAPYWKLDNLTIDFKNGGYAEVNVKDSIKGNIKNSAKFLYYNDPVRAFKVDKTATVTNKNLDQIEEL